MRTRRIFKAPVLALEALFCYAIMVPAQQTKDSNRSSVFTSSLPAQQRQFCSAFQQDGARREEFLAKIAAAGDNPIAQRLAEKNKPDFEKLFGAQELAVVGNGVFEDWVGRVVLTINGERAYIAVGFPCVWTDYRDDIIHPRFTELYIGTGFSPPVPGVMVGWYPGSQGGVPIDSAAGRELASLTQGETVTVSGALECTALSDTGRGGCRSINGAQPGILWATITSLRSTKTGTVLQFAEGPHVNDNFDRVNIRRKGNIVFYQSDDIQTLREKARALVAQRVGPESTKLLEYLNPPASDRNNKFAAITITGYDLARDGRLVMRQVPCLPNVMKGVVCTDSVVAYVVGDLPALNGRAPINNVAFVPGNNGKCYRVSADEQATLQQRTQQINDLLRPVSLRLEPDPTAPSSSRDACAELNALVDREAVATKQRSAELKSVSVSMMADEFELRLQEAVGIRAQKLGLDPSQYASATKSVSDIVRLCSSIPESDYVASLDQFGNPHLLNYEGGRFKDCIPTGVFRGIPEPKDAPGFLIRHDIRHQWDSQQKRWFATKFHIEVFLKPITSEKVSSVNEFEARYVALSADIANGGAAALSKYLCGGAHIMEQFVGNRDGTVILSKQAKITRLSPGRAGEVTLELEGYNGLYTGRSEQIKDSCGPDSVPSVNPAAVNAPESSGRGPVVPQVASPPGQPRITPDPANRRTIYEDPLAVQSGGKAGWRMIVPEDRRNYVIVNLATNVTTTFEFSGTAGAKNRAVVRAYSSDGFQWKPGDPPVPGMQPAINAARIGMGLVP